ncbi:MAG: hypothetical protein QNJ30_20680 [Kiloniellales bacterium]|nr:hypothetical protein [Kiloniellales bacterium]
MSRVCEAEPERSEKSVIAEVARKSGLEVSLLSGWMESCRYAQAEAGVYVRRQRQPEREEESIIAEVAAEAGLDVLKLYKQIKDAKESDAANASSRWWAASGLPPAKTPLEGPAALPLPYDGRPIADHP